MKKIQYRLPNKFNFSVDMYTTLDIFLIRDLHLDILDILCTFTWTRYENGLLFIQPLSSFFQLSELEHRVVEAETRAEDAEGKVRKPNTLGLKSIQKMLKTFQWSQKI